jgi:hypothetical protein
MTRVDTFDRLKAAGWEQTEDDRWTWTHVEPGRQSVLSACFSGTGLLNFVSSVAACVHPDQLESLPPDQREHAAFILSLVDPAVPVRHLDTRLCARCGVDTPEFVRCNEELLCFPCAEDQ